MNNLVVKNDTKDLNKLLCSLTREGLFSHYYLSCGSYELGYTNEICYQLLPERRHFFDLASITKAILTVPLLLHHFGPNILNKSVEFLLGKSHELSLSSSLRSLNIGDVVNHRSGLPAWKNFWLPWTEACVSNDKLLVCLNRCQIKDYGKYLYSDVGYILLGLLLSTRLKRSLEQLFYNFCTEDLGLEDPSGISFFPPPANAVPTSYCHLRRRFLCGEVHDENCAALGGACGHAGLFANGLALEKYLQALFSHSIGHILVDSITRHGCGWQYNDEMSKQGKEVWGHLGFTGTAFWVSFVERRFSLVLTNRVISGRNPGTKIKRLRNTFLKYSNL